MLTVINPVPADVLTKPLVVYPPIKIVLSPFNFNISAAEPFKKAKLSVDVPANVYVLAALSAVKLAFPKLFEAGNVHFPSFAPWTKEVIHELQSFPNGANDDIVDAISQGLQHFNKLSGSRRLEAMSRL